MNKLLAIFLGAGVLSLGVQAEQAKMHSSLEVKEQLSASLLELHFIPVAQAGVVLNLDAPWQLTLSKAEGMVLQQTVYKKSSFDSRTAELRVSLPLQVQKGGAVNVHYSLAAFTCTNDKKQCFRDLHQGKISKGG